MAMHNDELFIDDDVVRRLISSQFPAWRNMPVRRLAGEGTDNAIFRIGSKLTARFPLRFADPVSIQMRLVQESLAMGELHTACPFPTPSPVALGQPGYGYPLPWSVQSWISGQTASPNVLASSNAFTQDLAVLIRSLRAADTRGRPFEGAGRGGDLKDSDEWVEECFRQSMNLLPVDRLRALWAAFQKLPAPESLVMNHSDLIPGNLLVEGGRLVGVLDGGGFAPADPSLDLVAGWHMLDDHRRATFRKELACNDLEWWRGAAWAFQQAIGLVWYYQDSNPGMSALGRSTLARIMNDNSLSEQVSQG